jgi:hypothetical protein
MEADLNPDGVFQRLVARKIRQKLVDLLLLKI